MENSSNKNMEQVFEKLAKIKKVEPSTHLYSLTLKRINVQNIIPLFWVRAVACILILFVSVELYIVFNAQNPHHQSISIGMVKTNNMLYDE